MTTRGPAPTPPSPTAEPAVPRSVGRVLDLLEYVLDHGGSTLTEAATAVDLTPTTALRHLRALEARGYLRRDDGTFTAGPTMFRLAADMRDGSPVERLVAVVQPHLDRLASLTGESSYLALRADRNATYVAMAGGTRAIRHVGHVGQVVPLVDTAVGAAFASPGTVAVRHGGFEPDIGAASIAFGPVAGLEVAISVVGPTHRLGDATIAGITEHLAATAAAIRADVGLPASPPARQEASTR